MITLARLHQETDRIRRRLNPIPDLITFASNDIADRLKRYVKMKASGEESDTVYVNLKIDSEEDLETKYINLYIDTKQDVTARYIHLGGGSGYINTNVVYLNPNSASNNKPYPSYPRYHRHRQIK
jgi:CRISPR/Cas system CSM-associated protein Csm5 (group 7 of RAMP superfamily)